MGHEKKAVVIFIISPKGELLLHKVDPDAIVTRSLWHVPYFLYQASGSEILMAATQYLQSLGITDCTVYEAFTMTGAIAQTIDIPLDQGHVIIALVTTAESNIHFATDKYQWVFISKILSDTSQCSALQSKGFKETLESVILYVKSIPNHIANSSLPAIK